MTKAKDLRAQKSEELEGRAADLKKEQFNLRFQKATGQLENTSQMRKARRDIARIRTAQAAAGAAKKA